MNRNPIDENIEHERLLINYINALSSPELDNRLEAIRGLGTLADTRAIEPLIVALSKDSEWSLLGIRNQVVNEIRELGEHAIPELARLLESSSDKTRRAAGSILGDLGSIKAIPPLMDALQDQSAEIRCVALISIAKIDPSRALEPAITALHDLDSLVRYTASGLLHDIGDGRAVEALIASLNDVESDVRFNAAWALGDIGDERAIPALTMLIKDETELVTGHRVKDAAIQAIEGIGTRLKSTPS